MAMDERRRSVWEVANPTVYQLFLRVVYGRVKRQVANLWVTRTHYIHANKPTPWLSAQAVIHRPRITVLRSKPVCAMSSTINPNGTAPKLIAAVVSERAGANDPCISRVATNSIVDLNCQQLM